MTVPFAHLHNHSHFSVTPIDASTKIDEMVRRVAELDMGSIALTDHGLMSGAVQLWRECRKHNVRPVVGCELYVCDDRSLKDSQHRGYNHLVALAINQEGYKNLCRIVSAGYLEGFYYKPRVDKRVLAKYSAGIVVSSACLAGEVARILGRTDLDDKTAFALARTVIEDMVEIFGPENYYLEVQDHGIDIQRPINERIFRLSKEIGVPVIATNDCHFLYESDFGPHRSLKCIGMRMKIDDIILNPSKHVYRPDHRLKSYEEMREVAARYGPYEAAFVDAIHRTDEVAKMADFSFTEGVYYFPALPLKEGETLQKQFRREVFEGFENRSAKIKDPTRLPEYFQRLGYEISIIEQMGFESYFLVVSDFVRYAKRNGIAVGPGRGSAAGSLVSYSLDITDLDPIAHGLLFERFLNPARVSMPDIDIDFSKRRRQEVIDYVIEKYGREQVAQIITFGSLKPRAVLNDLGRVYGLTIPETQKVSHMIPDSPGDVYTLERAWNEFEELRTMVEANDKLKQIWSDALRLENTNRNAGIHPAGIVITPGPVADYVPIYKAVKDDTVAVSYNMKDTESLGLVKMDFLGLKTLDLIEDCLDLIEASGRTGVRAAFADIDLQDQRVLKTFADGRTAGIFQFESRIMRTCLLRLKPDRFELLDAMNALVRPGPMNSGMTDQFIRRRREEEIATAFHPAIREILEPTYGVMVYQEQVMQVVQKLAGFSLGEADLLRKAMGKKDLVLMQGQLDKFVAAAIDRGYDEAEMRGVAEAMQTFAQYGFNRAHSAAYAVLAFQTAYLKTYFPIEFMAALLTNETEDNDMDQLVTYVGEAWAMGISILPPDVNYSARYFSIDGDGERSWIRFGLAGIKGAGDSACAVILAERKRGGSFRSFPDLVDRCQVSSAVIEALVKAGATDSLRGHRATHYLNISQLADRKKGRKRKQVAGQNRLQLVEFDAVIDADMKDCEEWDQKTLSAYEKESLGLWLTEHPLKAYKDVTRDTIADLRDQAFVGSGRVVNLLVIISEYRCRLTKSGKVFGLVSAEDLTGVSTDLVLWGDEENEQFKAVLIAGNIVKINGWARPYEGKVRTSVKNVEMVESTIPTGD